MTTPDPTPSPLDDLIAAHLQSLERGESPNRAALLTANPQYAKDLAAFFADFDRVQAAAPGNHYANHANLDATKPPRGESHPGEIIASRYKLLENIGEGGMGSVWVAEQTQPVKRRVAIKLIKAGMDSKQVLARFEAERQALAMMDHPNIARVFDGGMTDLGRPYFVMEYVKGTPFTEYCDQARLSLKERLQLFIPVCGAVQHAHQKGIIHRDLKPSNILVCLYDGKPVPKVIDFGLAKAMHQPLTENSIYTGHGVMVGTPLYMSPEQAEQNNLDVDTRTDIYSLGVVLYELLTGATPLERDQLRKAAADEVLRLIREVEAIRPSIRMSASASLPSIAAQRNINPRELRKSLAGDLDWIVMKSLEKERSRRYETANGLARDIERYLGDEAVEACPPSTGYRLKKYFRKHKWQVTTATIVLGALILGMCGAIYGFIQATDGQRRTQNALVEITKQKIAKEKALNEKTAALDAVSKAKDLAERQMIEGMLRPIGHGYEPNTSELRSYVDWSALPNARLKIRILEIAFENPEIALRLAQRAERVSQASVGLSPIRRAMALKLLSAKQRDMQADPRIRVAAAWLALELGSTDLPALADALTWLSTPKGDGPNASPSSECSELIELVASREEYLDQTQRSRLFDAFISIIENSADEDVFPQAAKALTKFVPRLTPEQTMRGWNALTDALDRSGYTSLFDDAGESLEVFAPRLSADQAAHASDMIQSVMEKADDSSVLEASGSVLAALIPQLSPGQVTRNSDVILGMFEKTKDSKVLRALVKSLVANASSLSPDQVRRAGDSLLDVLEKSTEWQTLRAASGAMAALAPKLSPEQAPQAWNALLGVLEKTTDSDALQAAMEALVAIAPKLSTEQVALGWDALFGVLGKSTDWRALDAAGKALVALAPKLSPEEVTRNCDLIFGVLEKSTDSGALKSAGKALEALAPMLSPEQVTRAGDALLDVLEKSMDTDALGAAGKSLVAIAQKLSPAQFTRGWNAYISVLEKSTKLGDLLKVRKTLVALAPLANPEQAVRGWEAILGAFQRDFGDSRMAFPTESLAALAPRLSAEGLTRSWESLIVMLDKGDYFYTDNSMRPVLEALVPKLTSEQVTRTQETLLEVLKKSTDQRLSRHVGDLLVALASKLTHEQKNRTADLLVSELQRHVNLYLTEPLDDLLSQTDSETQERVSSKAMRMLLDYLATSNTYFDDDYEEVRDPDRVFGHAAMSVTNQRALATLFRHPACIGEAREWMLLRFEELVLHGGNRIYFSIEQPKEDEEEKTDAANTPKPAPPPRRFKTLHDASTWIQKNWPDFDLESTPEVKPWREE